MPKYLQVDTVPRGANEQLGLDLWLVRARVSEINRSQSFEPNKRLIMGRIREKCHEFFKDHATLAKKRVCLECDKAVSNNTTRLKNHLKVCKPFFDLKAVAAIEVPVIKAKRTITTISSGASSQKRQRKEPLVTTLT